MTVRARRSLWGANPYERAPAGRIAGRKAFFQALVDLVLGFIDATGLGPFPAPGCFPCGLKASRLGDGSHALSPLSTFGSLSVPQGERAVTSRAPPPARFAATAAGRRGRLA